MDLTNMLYREGFYKFCLHPNFKDFNTYNFNFNFYKDYSQIRKFTNNEILNYGK